MDWFDIPNMTVKQAEFIKKLRVPESTACLSRLTVTYTWRSIAEICNAEFGGTWGSDQDTGRELCRQAAKVLGEEEWN